MINHTIVRTGGAALCLLTAGFVVGFMLRPSAVDPGHEDHTAHYAEQTLAGASAHGPANLPDVPPDDSQAEARLAASPRHAEWAEVRTGDGAVIRTFVVHPERSTNAPVVIVVHDAYRDFMGPWIRSVADQLARDGFIAIVPDMLSGKGPNGGGTESLGADAAATLRTLADEELSSRLNAVAAYGRAIRSSNGKVATLRFCWGGGVSFNYALTSPMVDAAVSFYGPMPTSSSAYAIAKAPILGLYAGNDNRVNVNIVPRRANSVSAVSATHRSSTTAPAMDFSACSVARQERTVGHRNRRGPRAVAFLRQLETSR